MKLSKTPDTRWEVLQILEVWMREQLPGVEEYHCGIQRMAAYYRQRCELSRAQADQWFQPLQKIEQHVRRGLKLPPETLAAYFTSPDSEQVSPAGIIAMAGGQTLTQEEACALTLLLADCPNEDNDSPGAVPFDAFIRALQRLELPDSYRWRLAELCSDWTRHQQIVEEILTRGAALFDEVVHLAQPLIDRWYEELSAQLTTGTHRLQVGKASILLDSSRDYLIRPALSCCNGTATLRFEPTSANLPRYAPQVLYGVLCDPIAARIEAQQQGDNALLRGLRALGDKQRLRIFRALTDAPRYSGELVKLTGLSPATVSHHMSELLGAGLVEMEDAGQRVIYHISREGTQTLADALDALVQSDKRKVN